MNIFRLTGDLAHISSKCILIWAIHRNKSAEGISALTQGMYALVFCTRYLDLFWAWISLYNTVAKIFYLASSFYILFIMLRVYPYTRESHKAYGMTVYSVAGSMIIAPPVIGFAFGWGMIFSRFGGEVFWAFSIILESVCVLPQLILLRQTTVPTVIDSYYLLALGSYRGFYILNWIYRWFTERMVDPIAVTFGIIQTALYVDFAWVYYGRQRIKLRAGALIDSQITVEAGSLGGSSEGKLRISSTVMWMVYLMLIRKKAEEGKKGASLCRPTRQRHISLLQNLNHLDPQRMLESCDSLLSGSIGDCIWACV
ncbi:hypothetical protein BDZ89DRAFT_1154510 [Hymenopellis radicata]|nr:hypothetical protein BDZ89DRAFT_1154510 [Hymenopellis radicata]